MYENYPFWFTFFTELGYDVVLSSKSSRELYDKGISTIPSETACYPAKLVHGHIIDLIEKGVDFIFYPSVFYEKKEDDGANNHLNCPVVTSYPEVVKNNIEDLEENNVLFLNPFVTFDDEKAMKKVLNEFLKELSIPKGEINKALDKAWKENEKYKDDIRNKGKEVLEYLEDNGKRGIVLAGRPYHIDPEINKGI